MKKILVLCYSILFLFPALAQRLEAPGITEPYRDATLSAAISGTITTLNFNEGEFVKKGQIVLQLKSNLEALEVERRKLISESKVEMQSARSQMETIGEDLEGSRRLYEKTQSVSKEELQKKELEYKLAQAELERININEKLEAIEYKIALAQLQERMITAPFDGIITKYHLEVGENCNPQQPLLRIVDIRICRLVCYVESDIKLKLKQGLKVNVKIYASSSAGTYPGTIEFVSPVIDPSSGLREVKVLFDNPGGKVQPGVMGSMVIN